MRLFWVCSIVGVTVASIAGQDLSGVAWDLEIKGEAAQAHERLQKAAQSGDVAAIRSYAEFLDRHRDPAAREAYAKLADALKSAGAPQLVEKFFLRAKFRQIRKHPRVGRRPNRRVDRHLRARRRKAVAPN